jgi:NAD(P)H-hydrate epimerase
LGEPEAAKKCASDFGAGLAIGGMDALAVGPGLGTGAGAKALVAHILRTYRGPLVLDADALNIIAADGEYRRDFAADTIITPHPGEAARLLGCGAADVQADRRGAVAALAEKYGAVAVLKGRGTLVAAPAPVASPPDAPLAGSLPDASRPSPSSAIKLYENTTGNPGMATAGSGDVLTGVIASFMAQGMSATDAAMAGVFIHGLAGDIAVGERGEHGLIATDIMATLPIAILRAA